MPLRRAVVPLIALLLAGCGEAPSPSTAVTAAPTSAPLVSPPASAAATPAPSGSASVSSLELPSGGGPIPPGHYTRSGFRPPVTFDLEAGWFGGTSTSGFFDVQQEVGTPDVIAVQFANVDGIVGAGGATVPATTVASAVETFHANPGLTVIDESDSRLGGLEGRTVVVENRSASTSPVMQVSAGKLAIDPKRRLWISLFDTPDGLLAVMVGGSVAAWERALTVAEPVLESVVVGGTSAAVGIARD